jgi:hypothetical protein
VLLVAATLAAAAVPAAARPYGLRGRDGANELRYERSITPLRRCANVYDQNRNRRQLCFHWTDRGRHVSSPGWVDATVSAFVTAWNAQVRDGRYLPPLRDAGGDDLGDSRGTDIYLVDIGDDGTFGSCTTDPGQNGATAPAYCIVDNDFAEFPVPASARKTELRGTAAHEFFHAVQYAYNTNADAWFAEGTAAWMEDQVFDGGNTNYRYLDVTALRTPEDPFDKADGSAHYGSWLFWQFLGECRRPSAVRSIWADVATTDGSDASVMGAIADLTGGIGPTLAAFGAWNYAVGQPWSYGEGAAYLQALGGTRPPLDAAHELTATRRSTDLTVDPDDPPASPDRTIAAGPYGVHYVRIKAAQAMDVEITVGDPTGAALIKQTGTSAFAAPALCGETGQPSLFATPTKSIELSAGQSALLVLTNPSDADATLTYRAVAP